MTEAQKIKLSEINPILNHYMNPGNDLVIITTYESKWFMRCYIGLTGRFSEKSEIYRYYDEDTRQPYRLLFKEKHKKL